MASRSTFPKPSWARRHRKAFSRRWREFKMIVKGLSSTDHPVQAQIIPMRRCNLACAYCNEYDDFSSPVPREGMFGRVDYLASLCPNIIVISGAISLLNPRIDQIIA